MKIHSSSLSGIHHMPDDPNSGKVRPIEPKAATPQPPAFNPENEPKIPPPALPSYPLSVHDMVRIEELTREIRNQSQDNS